MSPPPPGRRGSRDPFDEGDARGVVDGTARFSGVLPSVALVGTVVGDHYRLDEAQLEHEHVTVFAATRTTDDEPLTARRIPYPIQPGEHDDLRRAALRTSEWNHPLLPAPRDLVILRDGTPLFVYPLLDGAPLADRLARKGRLSLDEALTVARDVAGGLARVHKEGGTHGSISPAHVQLAPGDAVRVIGLLDVGVGQLGAKRRAERGIADPHLRLLGYLAPELGTGGAGDTRSDQFGLAAVLYHAIGGRPPFGTGTPRAMLSRILSAEPAPLQGASLDVERALRRALAKAPGDRFSSLAEMIAALEQAAGRSPGARAGAARAHRDRPRAPLPSTERPTLVPGPAAPRASSSSPTDRAAAGASASAAAGASASAAAGAKPKRPPRPGAVEDTDVLDALRPAYRSRGALLVAGAALLLGAVIVAVIARHAQPPAPADEATPTAAPVAEPAPPAIAHVTLELVPAEAHVSVEGHPVMPQDVELPRSSVPVALTVEAPGYVSITRQVVPDRDQHLVVHLTPAPPPSTPRSRAPAPAPSAKAPAPSTKEPASHHLRLPPLESELRDPFGP